jgi:hypothetical protein
MCACSGMLLGTARPNAMPPAALSPLFCDCLVLCRLQSSDRPTSFSCTRFPSPETHPPSTPRAVVPASETYAAHRQPCA